MIYHSIVLHFIGFSDTCSIQRIFEARKITILVKYVGIDGLFAQYAVGIKEIRSKHLQFMYVVNCKRFVWD